MVSSKNTVEDVKRTLNFDRRVHVRLIRDSPTTGDFEADQKPLQTTGWLNRYLSGQLQRSQVALVRSLSVPFNESTWADGKWH